LGIKSFFSLFLQAIVFIRFSGNLQAAIFLVICITTPRLLSKAANTKTENPHILFLCSTKIAGKENPKMRFRITIILSLLLTACIAPNILHAEVVKIGVLAPQGFHSSMTQWQSTSDYLSSQMPQHVFQILPYSRFSDIKTDLKKNKLDFLLVKKSELPRFVTDFSLRPLLNTKPGANNTSWTLARNTQLPYQLIYSITDVLLKLPANHQAISLSGFKGWELSSDEQVAISSTQQLTKLYNTAFALTKAAIKQYWALMLAGILSALLIVLYRKWDRYHIRRAQVKQHSQQSRDPSLSDTVF
jgi:hypothetical protein